MTLTFSGQHVIREDLGPQNLVLAAFGLPQGQGEGAQGGLSRMESRAL